MRISDWSSDVCSSDLIQQGCDHRCTFCIIPYGRGPSRSLPLGVVVEQARALAARGYREFVLTGVDITSYGHELPGRPKLGRAVRRLPDLVPQIRRLRFYPLHPAARKSGVEGKG